MGGPASVHSGQTRGILRGKERLHTLTHDDPPFYQPGPPSSPQEGASPCGVSLGSWRGRYYSCAMEFCLPSRLWAQLQLRVRCGRKSGGLVWFHPSLTVRLSAGHWCFWADLCERKATLPSQTYCGDRKTLRKVALCERAGAAPWFLLALKLHPAFPPVDPWALTGQVPNVCIFCLSLCSYPRSQLIPTARRRPLHRGGAGVRGEAGEAKQWT